MNENITFKVSQDYRYFITDVIYFQKHNRYRIFKPRSNGISLRSTFKHYRI